MRDLAVRDTGTLTVLQPTSSAVAEATRLADRPSSLAGLVLGVLDNGKPNSDRFLAMLVEELADQDLGGVHVSRKPSIGRLAPAAVTDELVAACDVVVTGVGDCAGCCSCTAHDGIGLERRGIPTAVVCTDEFLVTARLAARTAGAPDFGFVVIDHPLGSATEQDLRKQAQAARTAVLGELLAER